MDDPKYFPVTSSFIYQCYHPFGNFPPKDLLQSITTDTPRPDVLLLGCGDLYSCLHTLWNNFDPRHARSFKGVRFVLNDITAAVLARNILFLYLCTQMPASHNDKLRWVASLWAIWCCHEILPHHKQVLKYALSNLLKWSSSIKSWTENGENPVRSLVQFTSSTDLSQIHEMWKIWYNDTYTISMKQMRTNRLEKVQKFMNLPQYSCIDQLFKYYGGIVLKNISQSDCAKIKDDDEFYLQNGFAFAEEVLGLPVEECTLVNSTFISKPGEKKLSLPAITTPYNNFCFANQDYPDVSVLVADDKFSCKPLLANSVQQFSIWLMSCSNILTQSDYTITFTFQCSDALEFCQQLHNNPPANFPLLFDAIYTSNLMDYIAPPSLVLLAMFILKPTGTLFTETLCCCTLNTATCEELLWRSFGFDCKHLQILCGVRCLGFENEYSDVFSIESIPVNFIDMDAVLDISMKCLVWRHVLATPPILNVKLMVSIGQIFISMRDAIANLLNYQDSWLNPVCSCSGTVMIVLQSFASRFDTKEFASQFDGEHTFSYRFWTILSHLLIENRKNSLSPYLTSLQTQALLHGVHLHLIVSESDCPLCKKQSVLEIVSQCSLTTSQPNLRLEKQYRIIVYDKRLWNGRKCYSEFSCIDGIHIIDTIATSITSDKLMMDFFLLDKFLRKNYYFTVFYGDNTMVSHKRISTLITTKNVDYSFTCSKPPRISQELENFDLGVIDYHEHFYDDTRTFINLSDTALSALSSHKLTTVKLSDTNIQFKIGDYCTTVCYPFPVDYGNLSIQLSRKKKTIEVLANRIRHNIHDEEPVFIVNPDNALRFPAISFSQTDASEFGLWYNPSLSFPADSDAVCSNVQAVFSTLFCETTEQFFTFSCSVDGKSQPKFFIAILNRVFDVHNKTPAIDMLFLKCSQEVNPIAELKIKVISIPLKDNTCCRVASKVLNYFANSTVATMPPPKKNSVYQLIVEHKIEYLFTRAVIYPLYTNADRIATDQTQRQLVNQFLCNDTEIPKDIMPGFHDNMPYWFKKFKAMVNRYANKCSNCHCVRKDLKTCGRCHLVQYCNGLCQKQHWKTHKPDCKIPPAIK